MHVMNANSRMEDANKDGACTGIESNADGECTGKHTRSEECDKSFQLPRPFSTSDSDIIKLGLQPFRLRAWLLQHCKEGSCYSDTWDFVTEHFFSWYDESSDSVPGESNLYADFRAMGFTQAAAQAREDRGTDQYDQWSPAQWGRNELELNMSKMYAEKTIGPNYKYMF